MRIGWRTPTRFGGPSFPNEFYVNGISLGNIALETELDPVTHRPTVWFTARPNVLVHEANTFDDVHPMKFETLEEAQRHIVTFAYDGICDLFDAMQTAISDGSAMLPQLPEPPEPVINSDFATGGPVNVAETPERVLSRWSAEPAVTETSEAIPSRSYTFRGSN